MWEGVQGAGIQYPTFDDDSKSAKIINSLYGGWGGGGGLRPTSSR